MAETCQDPLIVNQLVGIAGCARIGLSDKLQAFAGYLMGTRPLHS